jgi:hypothetical protein
MTSIRQYKITARHDHGVYSMVIYGHSSEKSAIDCFFGYRKSAAIVYFKGRKSKYRTAYNVSINYLRGKKMNNYDQSSSGEKISFHVNYDHDLATIYYDCFESENTRLSFGRDFSLFLIGEAEAPFFNKTELNKFKKEALFNLCLDYEILSYNASLNDYTKADYVSDLLNISIKRHYEYLIANYTWHNIGENISHDYFISRGYSQGDAVYIVKLDGPIDSSFRNYVNNILWDCPISIYADIDGLEFSEDQFLTDNYSYDKSEVIEKIKGFSISDYAKNWLIEALPEYPKSY